MNGPFVLPVRDLMHRPGQMREFTLDLALLHAWGEGLVAVPEGTPLDLAARLESVHEGILVTAEVRTRYEGVCGRCLTDIAEPVEVEFQELFGYPGDEASDFEVRDDHVDLEAAVRDSIVLSLPFQPVCRPDCVGLDPVTGEKLTSDVTREDEIDPRWAALKAYSDPADADTE
ncbi:YceD family protein [Microbacterium sp.]|uniref:YceD family protein n=1 Tax=Microbacterium sp. TaxID=51671 RepID=UPI003A88D9B1